MQAFAILLLAANLALSALAMPMANDTISVRSSNGNSVFCGTQVGSAAGLGCMTTPVGACGWQYNPAQYVVSISWQLYDNYPGYNGLNPTLNPVCGRQIQARYYGHVVTATVVDRCPSCGLTDLCFSPAAFSRLADPSAGLIRGISWTWL